VRIFVADEAGGDVSELTSGGRPVVRLTAPDLQRAKRGRARIRAAGRSVAVVLDVAVAVPGDFRAAAASRRSLDTVHYAGTVAGLAGLIADIGSADVADGVTLIPTTELRPGELRRLGQDVLDRLADREPKSA
jgi:hypothetical protein